ncbi:MAG: serine hydrolase [Salinivirgaceae bacterium]|nr:serine hydrolase [Salinivirgaceae bacterium]
MIIKYLSVAVELLACLAAYGNSHDSGKVEYTAEQEQWADSVLNTLDTRQKIAQLIMMAVYSNKTESYNQQTVELFEQQQIGGIIFMQGGPVRQAMLCNRIQAVLNIPAMVAIDAEYGLGMRLDSTIYYPRAMALGAIGSTEPIYDFGAEVARQCRRLGVNINFAPVLDINVEPQNPIINSRSFGENKTHVTNCASAYARGMQDNGVLAVGKHFPGHGDTHTDSHLALPLVDHSRRRLNDIELYPFRKTADLMGGMLVAHLAVPALEPDTLLPSTLSKRIVDSLLINDLGYKGLIFTDALNMRGVANAFEPGELEVRAFMAGNDILLFPKNAELAINSIEQAIADSLISIVELNRRCRKVLAAKAWMGLNHYQPIDTTNLYADLHSADAVAMQNRLTGQSLTLIKNKGKLPINNLSDNKILSITLGGTPDNKFQQQLLCYAAADTINLTTYPTDSVIGVVFDSASTYNTVIVITLGTNELQSKNFGVIPESVKLIDTLALNGNVILVHLGNPYALAKIQNVNNLQAILVGFRANSETQELAAQAIFGGQMVKGRIPVSANGNILEGAGTNIDHKTRLTYTTAEYCGLKTEPFSKIDSIINQCITNKIMPGCQLLFAVKGNVVYNKAFGYHTYDSVQPVQLTDIYDIASVTKVAATTTALMMLYDQKRFKPNDKLSAYVPMLAKSNKKDLKINQIMTHQAGLKGWIPFYQNTFAPDGSLRPDLYSTNQNTEFSIQISDSLFLNNKFLDTIYSEIAKSPLGEKKYLYSDLGFYLFPLMIEKLSGMKIDEYCNEKIFKPLGMSNTGYMPLTRFDTARIVPSEIDNAWRHDTIRGFVNDQGAAMLGGVSGHAGLFSNANDLAKLCQMWLNGGTYGSAKLFSPNTVKTFTTAPFSGNRRALGFDRPLANYNSNGPTCKQASQKSFGHSGFTGAYIWIDPEYECFMVFLTNRTYPTSKDNKLAKLNIRTQIQDLFYQAIIKD